MNQTADPLPAEKHALESSSRPNATPFTAEEESSMHRVDIYAATVIVCLLLGIFSIGLSMYLFICFSVL